MGRVLVTPDAGSTIVGTLNLYEGGTGAVTAAGALTTLGAVPAANIDIANGIAGLDANGQLDVNQISDQSLATVSVTLAGTNPYASFGAGLVRPINGTTNFTITNWDMFTTYVPGLIGGAGSVSIDGDTVTYTSPAVAGSYGFTINGKLFPITIATSVPVTPSLTVALNGSLDTAIIALLQTSVMVSYPSGSATHASTTWEIATDPHFDSKVLAITDDVTNKTLYKLAAGTLVLSKQYYARARHKDSNGNYSSWSETFEFATPAKFIATKEEAKLVPNTGPQQSARFGCWTAISDDKSRVIIGSYGAANTVTGTNPGAVYVFFKNPDGTWSQEAKITSQNEVNNGQFGQSVSCDSTATRLAVSAGGENAGLGRGYVYLRTGTTWTMEASFIQPGGFSGNFGTNCMTASGDRVAFTSRDTNAVFVFSRTGVTWALEKKIVDATPSGAGEMFGSDCHLSLDGTRIAIGAFNKTITFAMQGCVQIFLRTGTTWALEQQIVVNDAAANDAFGTWPQFDATAVRLAVGKTWSLNGKEGVYIFSRAGTVWTQEAILKPADWAPSDQFGNTIKFNSNATRIVIGAMDVGYNGLPYTGAVYIFSRTGTAWTQEAKIVPSDVTEGARCYCTAVSPNCDYIVVSAYGQTEVVAGLIGSGAVYIYCTG